MAGFVKANILWSLLTLPLGLVSLYMYLFKRKPRLDLKDKVVFITGASSGLGKACAEAFFKARCKVILSGRNKDSLLKVRDQLLQSKDGDSHCEPDIVVMDLEDLTSIPDKMREALSIFGHIDIVVNNAGLSSRGLGIETDLDVYQKLMNVNFYAQMLVTKALLPHMMQRKSGQIVIVSSVQGLMAIPSRTAYAASKHALEGYFNSLRAELSTFNIDVCIVNPAYIKTNLSMNALSSDGTHHGALDQNTAKGYEPSYVATQIVGCVANRTENKLISPTYIHLAIYLRTMIPPLYFKLMERRHQKEQLESKKES